MNRYALAAFLAAAPAMATAGAPPPLPAALLSSLPSATNSPKATVTQFRFGEVTVRFEKTPLSTVAGVLGGAIAQSGDAGDSLRALCYRLSQGRTLWLASTEMGGQAGAVMIAAVDAGPPAPACHAPGRPSALDLEGPPGVGATTAAVGRYFGAATPTVVAAYELTSRLTGGGSLQQRIEYRFRHGRVARVTLSRLSSF